MWILAHGDASSVNRACRQDITCSMGSSGRGKQRNSILTPERQNTEMHLGCVHAIVFFYPAPPFHCWQIIHGCKINKIAVTMKKWYVWVRRFLFIIPNHQNTKTTSLQIIDLFMRGKKVCRCASLYPTLDASCPPLIPQRSLWWQRLLERGQGPWRELRGRPLSLHQLRIQCCSATGPQHAGRVPRNCDSGVLLCL